MEQVQWSFYQLLWRNFERVRSNLCGDKIYKVKICCSIATTHLQKMKYRKLILNLYMFPEEGFLKLPFCRTHKINLRAANTKVVLSLCLFCVRLFSVCLLFMLSIYLLAVSAICLFPVSVISLMHICLLLVSVYYLHIFYYCMYLCPLLCLFSVYCPAVYLLFKDYLHAVC